MCESIKINIFLICNENAMELENGFRKYESVLNSYKNIHTLILISQKSLNIKEDIVNRNKLKNKVLFIKELNEIPSNLFDSLLLAQNIINDYGLIVTNTKDFHYFYDGEKAMKKILEFRKQGFYCKSINEIKHFFYETK